MGAIVPRSYPKQPKQLCQATVEDFENGTHYNLTRSFTVPEHRSCKRNAKVKLGSLCLCTLHAKLAKDGLVEEDGTVASRSVIADVRRYPTKFAGGIYKWAKDLMPEEIK